MVPGVCWRSATSAAIAGRGAGVAVASFCASSVEDEDDDVSFVYIHAKRYVDLFGPCWAEKVGLLVGCAGGLLRPEEVQVRFSPLLFFFYFCSYFLFSFSNLHSILNSNLNLFLFCRCLITAIS
jgi:hypothetical protein